AVAVGFAGSVAKPLRDLAAYAHAVNEGHLDADPPMARTRGPRETRMAVAVFTDLVANLRLLDAKANALASCTFDDPVLRQPLPGRLGRSLENSVAVLSGSIVERDRLQIHLAHQATHDSLTGIANRAAAVVGIQEATSRAERNGEAMALLFVDLNDFKSVNDRHGHEMGDEVLRQIASRLSGCARAGDLVARLGGDEFVLVSERIAGVDGAMELAHRVVAAVSRPIDLGALSVTVGAAVGVAMTLDGPEDPLRLLARADAAMYRAKHHDRSAIEMFDVVLQRQLVEREDVERALALALAEPDGGGLLLHFQPILRAGSGAIAGVEALVRWNRPGRGFLPPDAFVPIAESTSLIIELDRWVLAEVGRHLLSWSEDPELAHIPVAVNISGRHLQSGELVRHIASFLEQTGLDPSRLEIEITETVLLDDLVVAAAELDAVRGLGVRVAIDDFGTGYTSLAHLRHLPIDMIKIDRSLVAQLNLRRGSSLVRMVTDLGHAIDLGVIAEGVETDEELSVLRDMGADEVQGYLISGPLDPARLKAWVHERQLVGSAVRRLPSP
ncbi:MAG TPA: EAL domain-containing protein, partial [Acidimicrobiales bacterium]|nr:EAL domain-containing protein [Acidimicrobiales bacterium]